METEGKSRATKFTPEVAERHNLPQQIASVRRGVQTPGTRIMADYLSGKAISRSEAMRAKCAECMCWHADGRQDCKNEPCPLYPWMPYRRGADDA
jgi:hypothetical protein